MEGTAGIDIDHQVVSESAEAFADGDVAPVVGFDSAEDERHLLARVVIDDGNPAIGLLDDG